MLKIWLCLGLILIGLTGCSDSSSLEVVSERDEKHFNRGQLKLSQQRYDEALGAFLKVIDKRTVAPESQLEAGRIYQDYLGDPVAAIYHFRKYLEIEPDSQQAPLVRQMIESSKKDFARQLPGKPYDDEIERLDLLEIIESVRAENLELKRQLAASRTRTSQLEGATVSTPTFSSNTRTPPPTTPTPTRPTPTPTRTPQPTPTPTPTQATTTNAVQVYRVQGGDTLSRISTKFYGDPARWQDIFNANRDTLPSPHSLKLGQELRIPAE